MNKIFLIIIASISLTAIPYGSSAQADTARIDELMLDGGSMYFRKSYDSSLNTFLTVLQLIEKGKMLNDGRVTIVYNYLGDNYEKKKDAEKAHKYFTLALQASRKLGIISEKEKAVQSLFMLHQHINKENLDFKYPVVAETEEEDVYFPLGVNNPAGDSLDVPMIAGRLDGISDSIRTVDIYTHHSPKDTIHHNDITFYGTARVISLGNNRTMLRVKKHATIPLMPGDIGILKANVPLSWRKFSLRKFLLFNIYLVDNYRLPLFHYRYFYYYQDSLLENEIFSTFKTAVDEIVDLYGKDTLTTELYSAKNPGGIFGGDNVIRAMAKTEPAHIRLFLNFVHRFPAKYIGNDYKFAETYATWIINNTPLDPADVKPYLLSIKDIPRRKLMAKNLASDVSSDNLIDKWFDEGMQQVKIENIAEATKTADLIRDVALSTGDNFNLGWSDFLFANIEKRMAHGLKADSFLTRASDKFREASNSEGQSWINDLKAQWKKGNKISVNVQNGHMLPYVIAQSNNPRYFATGGVDYLIKIWDRTLNKEVVTLSGHNDQINSLQFSPNGRYLLSTSDDSTICVWNAYTYTKLYTYKTPKPERVARFSTDTKYIVSAGYDSLIKFRELHTGKIVKTLKLHSGTVNDLFFHPVYPFVLFSAGSDSLIYKWDIDTGEMTRWYRQQGKALSVKLSNDGKYMSVVSTDSLVTVWSMSTNKKLFWGRIHVSSPGTVVFYSSESFTPDSKHIAYPHAKDSFVVISIKDLYERVYPAKYMERNLCDLQFTNDGTGLFARYDLGGPLRLYNFAGWDIRNSPTISWIDIKPFANLPIAVQFTKDDDELVVIHSEISKLDLKSGRNEFLYYGYALLQNQHILVEDDSLGIYTDKDKPIINFFDYKNKEVARIFGLPETEKLKSFEISPASDFCYLGSEQGMIRGFDTRTKKTLFTTVYATGEESAITYMHFDRYKKRLFAITDGGLIKVLNALNGDSIITLDKIEANYLVCSPAHIYVTTEDGWLYKLDASTFEEVKKIKLNDGEGAYFMAISDDNKYLTIQNTFQKLTTVRVEDDSILYTIHDHDFGGTLFAISHDGKRIATAGFDSKVNLYETTTGKLIVSIYYPMDKNVLIADDEGHYLAAKNTLDAISLTYNNTAYSFDQFDVKLNRPDIILQKIGRADSNLLKTYHAAYKKRLSKLKISEENIGTEVHLPLVRIPERFDVQPATTKAEFELIIECSDSRFDLRSLQVLVNNSPLLGITGMDLRPLKTKQTEQKIKIPLSSGRNSIKVFCTNSKGAISLSETFSIVSKYKLEKPSQTYFIGIGISGYKDSRMNLNYAAKDVRDLAKTFDDLYSNISFDTLIDIKATKENILALKKKLMQTTVNDRVILAVTGHGLLSDSLDFYYATWDVDFNRPEKRGLKYEDLEDLLTGIPARQKLMLIDACHSGALDKDELLSVDNSVSRVVVNVPGAKGVKGIAPRGLGLKNKAKKMDANASFEMMQNLFTDLSNSNGAVIISAAGGMEYAFEGDKWNNGVFTYCVQQGIVNKLADKSITGNYDESVSVAELLMYVSRRVSELTNGKQKPTSRRDNVEYNWLLR